MKKFINIKRGPNFVGSAQILPVFFPEDQQRRTKNFQIKMSLIVFTTFFSLFFIAISDYRVLYPTFFQIKNRETEKSPIKKTQKKIVKTIRVTSKDMNK